MSQQSTLRLAAAAVVALALVLGYLGMGSTAPTPAANPEKLTIAVPTLPQAGLMQIAAARGYFTDEGLDVTMLPVSHGKRAHELMVQRKADLAVTADVPFVISVMQGEALAIMASMFSYSGDYTVVARRDHGITAARDLVGKRIGITFGTSGDYALWAFLIRHRIAPAAVTLVDLPPDLIPKPDEPEPNRVYDTHLTS